MTTNKPEVKRYDCTSGGRSHCYGCYTMTETEDGDYVSAEDYETLQAECEKLRAEYEEALFCVRQDRDAHFGELMRALEQADALRAECRKPRKDAERLDFIGQHPGWLRSHKGRWE